MIKINTYFDKLNKLSNKKIKKRMKIVTFLSNDKDFLFLRSIRYVSER